jgi:hypothetical protein
VSGGGAVRCPALGLARARGVLLTTETPGLRKLRAVVAAVSTLSGGAPGMSETARMASEAIEAWLRNYDGYRGLLVLTDEESERAQLITLWESAVHEHRARTGRGSMRDQLAATVGMTVETFDVYEVPVCEVVSDGSRAP